MRSEELYRTKFHVIATFLSDTIRNHFPKEEAEHVLVMTHPEIKKCYHLENFIYLPPRPPTLDFPRLLRDLEERFFLNFEGTIILPYLQAPGTRNCFKSTGHMKISLAFLQLEPEADAEAPLLEWAPLLVAVS